jgi:hypothetical protein
LESLRSVGRLAWCLRQPLYCTDVLTVNPLQLSSGIEKTRPSTVKCDRATVHDNGAAIVQQKHERLKRLRSH